MGIGIRLVDLETVDTLHQGIYVTVEDRTSKWDIEVPVQLPWIFPGAPLILQGNAGNIQSNLTGMQWKGAENRFHWNNKGHKGTCSKIGSIGWRFGGRVRRGYFLWRHFWPTYWVCVHVRSPSWLKVTPLMRVTDKKSDHIIHDDSWMCYSAIKPLHLWGGQIIWKTFWWYVKIANCFQCICFKSSQALLATCPMTCQKRNWCIKVSKLSLCPSITMFIYNTVQYITMLHTAQGL